MRNIVLLVCLACGLVLADAKADAETAMRELWVNGKRVTSAKVQVVMADRENVHHRFREWFDASVADLKRILPEFGVELSEDTPFTILVGGDVPKALQARAQKERYPNQAAVIKVTDQGIHITSPGARGFSKAVYTFLDRLGVRWYMPGKLGESLPEGKVALSKGAIVEGPDFMFRTFYWGGDESHYPKEMRKEKGPWQRRVRMDNEFGFSGHSYTEQIVPPDKYGTRTPEYYSLVAGVRVAPSVDPKRFYQNHQLCVSNKEVQQLAIDFAKRRLGSSELHQIISISPNGDGPFCQCEGCQKIGTDTNQMVFLANVVARAIREEFPDDFIGYYVYDHTIWPPENMKLEPNVVPYIVNSYRRLYPGGHRVAWTFYAAPVRETALGEIIKGWGDLGGRTAIRFNWRLPKYPFNWVYHLQDDFRFFLENKGVGTMSQSTGSFVHQGWVNYWSARLSWDSELDIKAEEVEFYRRYYGPGAEAAKTALASVQNRDVLKPEIPMPIEALEKNVNSSGKPWSAFRQNHTTSDSFICSITSSFC